jgi:saccharopine dehydrogenase-like NADP-dependent oxidoreductase
MRVIIFGVTGMVGQSVLRECLLDYDVHEILAISRKVQNNDMKS